MGFSKPKNRSFVARVDGSIQKYVELLPLSFDRKKQYDLMIALHGHGTDRKQYIIEKRGECRGAREVAKRHGMIFISPDYRAKYSWMGPKAEKDLLQLIGLLKKKYRTGKVILVGGSMGGTSALIFASLYPKLIDGVSAQNPCANMEEFDNFPKFIAKAYGGTKKEVLKEYKKRSAELNYKRLTMPVAITTGGKDTIVLPGSALRLAKLLKVAKPRKCMLIHRAKTGHETNYSDTVRALEFVIKRS